MTIGYEAGAGAPGASPVGAPTPGDDDRRRGDERAAAGDWPGAVALWRVAAAAGDREAVARLRGFVGSFAGNETEAARLPRRALGPLAVCVEAAVFGLLAMVAANRVDGGPDAVLLWIGWAAWAVSLVAALVFAARSGRLDGGAGAALAQSASVDEVGMRATALAARMATARAPEAGGAA